MWTSLWIELMKHGDILADPAGRLTKWKDKAQQWRWRESEVDPVSKQARENLQASQNHIVRGDLFSSLLSLRESMTCIASVYLMKHNLIPSFRPKDLHARLQLIQEKEKTLLNSFNLVNNMVGIRLEPVKALVETLSNFIEGEWGGARRGPRTELENALGCLHRQDPAGALLSARYAAYWLGFHILAKRDIDLRARICNAENHIEMVKKIALVTQPFYEYYRDLHWVREWNVDLLRDALESAMRLLELPSPDERDS